MSEDNTQKDESLEEMKHRHRQEESDLIHRHRIEQEEMNQRHMTEVRDLRNALDRRVR